MHDHLTRVSNHNKQPHEKMYPCTICRTYVEVSAVVDHYRDAHDETLVSRYRVGPNMCDVCGDDIDRDYQALLDHYAQNHMALLDQ